MNNFVFAYKKEESDDQVVNSNIKNKEVVELHTNIWKVSAGHFNQKTKMYFDFGLKFRNGIKTICVYIPFEIEDKAHDYDLVKQLQNNNQLLCTVFNDDLSSTITQGATFTLVKRNKDGVINNFYLHQLGSLKFKKKNFFIAHKEKQKLIGTFLEIQIDEIPSDLKKGPNSSELIYIRFRIQPKDIKDVTQSEYISNDLLQAAFSKMDMFDIRVNETRDIHTDVMDKIRDNKFTMFNFNTVHLFFMAETNNNIENGSSIKSDSRLLESELWSSYIPGGVPRNCYIAHHWKKREKTTTMKIDGYDIKSKIEFQPFSDYRIYFTAVYPKIQWPRLVAYLSIVILLGWCGSMLSYDITKPESILFWGMTKGNIVIALFFLIVLIKIIPIIRRSFKDKCK